MGSSPTSVLDVAKYILESTNRPMSTMKLQKLAYYCQAWHAVWTKGDKLFQEPIEAWANGPVCYELFQEHKGKYSISAGTLNAGDSANVSDDQARSIDRVLDSYLPLSGAELSELTHDEQPWQDARRGLPSGARSAKPITVGAMRKYYAALRDDPGSLLVKDLERPTSA
jgi:uncharacterized phage-associated protein